MVKRLKKYVEDEAEVLPMEFDDEEEEEDDDGEEEEEEEEEDDDDGEEEEEGEPITWEDSESIEEANTMDDARSEVRQLAASVKGKEKDYLSPKDRTNLEKAKKSLGSQLKMSAVASRDEPAWTLEDSTTGSSASSGTGSSSFPSLDVFSGYFRWLFVQRTGVDCDGQKTKEESHFQKFSEFLNQALDRFSFQSRGTALGAFLARVRKSKTMKVVKVNCQNLDDDLEQVTCAFSGRLLPRSRAVVVEFISGGGKNAEFSACNVGAEYADLIRDIEKFVNFNAATERLFQTKRFKEVFKGTKEKIASDQKSAAELCQEIRGMEEFDTEKTGAGTLSTTYHAADGRFACLVKAFQAMDGAAAR